MDRVRHLKTHQSMILRYDFDLFIPSFDKIDLMQVIFCLFLKEDVALYRERMPLIFPSERSEPEGGKGDGGDTNSTEENVKVDEDSAKL